MSLTNPNKVVTEQRLNEYHNAILPYLGGMPEMVANKFSKGDLYSTEERMIGQWIDGKPLYQKVCKKSFGTVIDKSLSSIDFTDTLPIDVEYCMPVYAVCNMLIISQSWSNGAYWIRFIDSKNVETNRNIFSNQECTVIFKYTKTTDSPISIGSDTDYSTEEKIIGTWIDGKPIYQRVLTDITISQSNSWVYCSDTLGIDKLISLIGFMRYPDSNTNVQTPYNDQSNHEWLQIYYDRLYINSSFPTWDHEIIIQYTKTTD